MNHFILDASALVKRYVTEPGTPCLNVIMRQVGTDRRHCVSISALETLSIIVRARNGGRLPARQADAALALFHGETFGGGVQIIPARNDVVFGAAPLLQRHNINSADAVLLRAALDLRAALRENEHDLILVASDERLLRAADRERFPAFDPETEDTTSLDNLIHAG